MAAIGVKPRIGRVDDVARAIQRILEDGIARGVGHRECIGLGLGQVAVEQVRVFDQHGLDTAAYASPAGSERHFTATDIGRG